MSIAGVKFNSSCIILVVLVVNNFVELSHFSFDGAKLLHQTDKSCQYLKKNKKKLQMADFGVGYRLWAIGCRDKYILNF